MSKRDRMRRKARKRAREAEACPALVGLPTREPNGRRTRKPPSERVVKPTPEFTAARLAALPHGKGEMSDWIDLAEGQSLLTPAEAEAIRRYRAVVRAFLRSRSAPGMAAGTLASLSGSRGHSDGMGDEEAARRARNDLEDADHVLKQAHWRDAETLGNCVRERGLPTAVQLERCKRAAAWLIDHFGLEAR